MGVEPGVNRVVFSHTIEREWRNLKNRLCLHLSQLRVLIVTEKKKEIDVWT